MYRETKTKLYLGAAAREHTKLRPIRIEHRLRTISILRLQGLSDRIPNQVTEVLAFHAHDMAIDLLDDGAAHLLTLGHVRHVLDFAVFDQVAMLGNSFGSEDVVSSAHANGDAGGLAHKD